MCTSPPHARTSLVPGFIFSVVAVGMAAPVRAASAIALRRRLVAAESPPKALTCNWYAQALMRSARLQRPRRRVAEQLLPALTQGIKSEVAESGDLFLYCTRVNPLSGHHFSSFVTGSSPAMR